MADSSIITRIGGDASGLVAALDQAKQGVSKFADSASNILQRKLGMKDLFKGLLQGAGIASLTQVVEKLVAPFKASAESAKTIADETEKAADATERLIKLRQNDSQQLETMIKQFKRLQDEINKPPAQQNKFGPFGMVQRGSAIDKLFGLSSGADEKVLERRAQVARQLAEKGLEVETKRAEVKKKSDDDGMKQARSELAESEKLKDSTQKLANIEKDARREKMSDEERLADLNKEKSDVASQIAKYESFTAEGGTLTNDGVQELITLKETQRDIEKEIGTLTKKKADTEKEVSEIIKIRNTGRADQDLSDRELSRKEQQLKDDIFKRQAGSSGQYDFFLEQQKMNLGNLEKEAAFRTQVRQATKAFGENAAFNMFPGLTESRFAQVNTGERDVLKSIFEKIEKRLSAGIPVVFQGGND